MRGAATAGRQRGARAGHGGAKDNEEGEGTGVPSPSPQLPPGSGYLSAFAAIIESRSVLNSVPGFHEGYSVVSDTR